MNKVASLLAVTIILVACTLYWIVSPAAESVRIDADAANPTPTNRSSIEASPDSVPKTQVEASASETTDSESNASQTQTTNSSSTAQAPLDLTNIEASLRDLAASNMLIKGVNVSDRAEALLAQLLSAPPKGPALFAKLLQDPAFDFTHKAKLFWSTTRAHPEAASASSELIRDAAKAALAQNLADGLTDNLFLLPLATLGGGPAEEHWLLDKTESMTMRDSMDLGMAIEALKTINDPAAWTNVIVSADRTIAHNAVAALAQRQDPAVDEALHQAARDPSIDTKRRGMIWTQLTANVPEDDLPALASELTASSSDPDRLAASWALYGLHDRHLKDPAAIQAAQGLFATALADPLDEIALQAASTLAGAKLPVTPELLARMQDLVARDLPEAATLLEKLQSRSSK